MFGFTLSTSLRLTLALTCFLISAPAHAQSSSRYWVEVLIFAENNPSDDDNEVWHIREPLLIELQQSQKQAEKVNGRYSLIRGSRLAPYINKLESANYRPLKYLAWIQKPLPLRRIPKIPVKVSLPVEEPGGASGALSSELSGTVKLLTGPFLQFDLDLWYKVPLAEANQADFSDAGGPLPFNMDDQVEISTTTISSSPRDLYKRYHLKEQRRVKYKQIHYFDHPKFAVIATVYPHKNE